MLSAVRSRNRSNSINAILADGPYYQAIGRHRVQRRNGHHEHKRGYGKASHENIGLSVSSAERSRKRSFIVRVWRDGARPLFLVGNETSPTLLRKYSMLLKPLLAMLLAANAPTQLMIVGMAHLVWHHDVHNSQFSGDPRERGNVQRHRRLRRAA
jgi:hypothetical protein